MNLDYTKSKEIIAQTEILSDEDMAFVDANINEIQEVWSKRQIFRTETEMRMSVLNDGKFPTIAMKYWQAVRELSVFYESLVQASFAYRRNGVVIARIERKMAETTDELDLADLHIDLEEAQFSRINQHQVAQDRLREIRLWVQLLHELKAADPTFDSEDVDTHQLESYLARFESQAANLDANATPGERNNLLGQMYTAKRMVAEKKQNRLNAGAQKNAMRREQ